MIEEFQQPIRDSETSDVAVQFSQSKFSDHFIIKWIFACAIGYALGESIGILAGENIGYSLWDTITKVLGVAQEVGKYNYVFASALMGAVFGGATSFGQWLVLRRYVTNSIWWVWVGTICSSVHPTLNSLAYTVISLKVSNLSIYDWRFELSAFVLGVPTALVAGVLEWLILRKQFPNSAVWIGIRIIANSIVLVLSFLVDNIYPWFNAIGLGRFSSNALLGLVSGIIVGVIGGFALSSFFKQSLKHS